MNSVNKAIRRQIWNQTANSAWAGVKAQIGEGIWSLIAESVWGSDTNPLWLPLRIEILNETLD